MSGDYYSVLSLPPAAGRLLGPEDAAAPVAVISYAYWQRRSNVQLSCNVGYFF